MARTLDNSFAVHQYSPEGALVNVYPSLAEACAQTGYPRGFFSSAFGCAVWWPVKGFVWRKEEQLRHEVLREFNARRRALLPA